MKRRSRVVSVICAAGMTAAMLMSGAAFAEEAAVSSAAEAVASAAEEAADEAESVVEDAEAEAESIADDAATEAESIVADAEAEAESIVEDAEAEAESIVEDAEAEAESIEADAEAEAESIEAEAEAEAESIVEDAEAETESTAEDAEAETESTAEEEEAPRPEYNGSDYLTLGEYKGLTIEVEPIEITDAQIENRITSDIRNSEEGKETFTEGTVASGDVANIDFVGKLDGETFDGGSMDGYDLEIGSGTFIDGFEEGLIGTAIGDTVDLNLTFPETYQNTDLAGKDVGFTVTVNSVQRYKEMSDELASALSDGEAETVDAYRERVRTMLEEDALEERTEMAKSELLAQAADNSTISEYPQDLLEYTENDVESYYQSYASMYGVDLNTFLSAFVGVTEEDFPAYKEVVAQNSIKQEFAVAAISDQEHLLPEGDELAKAYDELAQQVGVEDGAALVAEYGEYTVKYRLQYEAVTQFLYDNANIVEKEPEEVTSEAEAAESETEEATSEAEAAESEAEAATSEAEAAESETEEAASEAEAAESEAEVAASEAEAAESETEEAASEAEAAE